MFEKIELIDDIRILALQLMRENPELDYAAASREAKIKILGSDVNFIMYSEAKAEVELSYRDIAQRELSEDINFELYSESQLKEIVIAHRMGIDVKSFINIFYTPEQIKFITIISAAGMDITPYTNNFQFDPEEELAKLESGASDEVTEGKAYVLEAA